jgi:parallel beta-helix repeat protein
MSYVNANHQYGAEPLTVVVAARHHGDYKTISDALWGAKPGTRILVRPGLYREGIVIDKPVEIIGDGKQGDIMIEATGKDTILFKAAVGKVANLTLYQAGGGKWFGVNITQGRLELEDCNISSQSLTCVAIHGSADPTLRRNLIYDSNSAGVLVSKCGKGTLEHNDIFDNAGVGVEIRDGCNPILRRNRISKNGSHGIRVWDGGGGIFEDNDLRGNAKGAWEIAPDCEARVQRKGNIE